MWSGDIALQIHHGKRGQGNTRIPNIRKQGRIVWLVQRSAACPKIFYFLNALPFWRSRSGKKKGIYYSISYFLAVIRLWYWKSFCGGELCKHRHKTHPTLILFLFEIANNKSNFLRIYLWVSISYSYNIFMLENYFWLIKGFYYLIFITLCIFYSIKSVEPYMTISLNSNITHRYLVISFGWCKLINVPLFGPQLPLSLCSEIGYSVYVCVLSHTYVQHSKKFLP